MMSVVYVEKLFVKQVPFDQIKQGDIFRKLGTSIFMKAKDIPELEKGEEHLGLGVGIETIEMHDIEEIK